MAQAVLILIAGWLQSAPAIIAPVDGQTLQGQVIVTGTIDAANFASAELAFAYASDATDTWFPIQVLLQPVQDSTITTWDTANLTDGDYRLRLRVFSLDGSYRDFTVNDLHLRNQIPAPSATPAATQTETAPGLTPTPTVEEPPASPATSAPEDLPATPSTLRPTPQPLPPNPAAITTDSVFSIFGRSALLALILFVVLGLFFRLRRT